MKYTIEKVKRSINSYKIDNEANSVDYATRVKKIINVIDVFMQEHFTDIAEVSQLVAELEPEIQDALKIDKLVGVRVHEDNQVFKAIMTREDNLAIMQRKMTREFRWGKRPDIEILNKKKNPESM